MSRPPLPPFTTQSADLGPEARGAPSRGLTLSHLDVIYNL
jgi:hypothetical protein